MLNSGPYRDLKVDVLSYNKKMPVVTTELSYIHFTTCREYTLMRVPHMNFLYSLHCQALMREYPIATTHKFPVLLLVNISAYS